MQTFLISPVFEETAKVLDRQRLGKQRVEALQILDVLLGIKPESRWKNHPAVKMWNGYEVCLLNYVKTIMDEWKNRGYKNTKCEEKYNMMLDLIVGKKLIYPDWFTPEFFEAHKSNLIRKKSDHYRKFFKNTPNNLEYIWPMGGQDDSI